jgi:diacylglycerol kinase (ATP)
VSGRTRIALLINPVARQGREHARIEHAIADLGRRSALDLLSPASDDDTERMARACAPVHDIVAVAGGDGTVHRALNGLAHSGTPIGVLPIGTGNDFARAFGIPCDPERAAATIVDGAPVDVDLVEVNGRLFGTVGVMGIGADSALAVSRWMSDPGARGAAARRLGGWTYRLAGLRQLLRPGDLSTSLAVAVGDDAPSGPRDLYALFVTNTTRLGGGLRLPVDARPDDGLLEVCVVPRIPRLRLLWAFLCFAQGWRIPDGVLEISRGTTAQITSGRPVAFSADGELVHTDRCFALTVHRHALRVICRRTPASGGASGLASGVRVNSSGAASLL